MGGDLGVGVGGGGGGGALCIVSAREEAPTAITLLLESGETPRVYPILGLPSATSLGISVEAMD